MSNVNIHHFPHGDILIVDDNTSDLKFLSGILRKAGYKVRPTSDGELALRSAQARLPALILLDIEMPGLDGYEVCRRLKDAKDTRDIPVIFVSVKTSPMDKVKAFGVGGVDYISKPLEAEDVLARVATHLALWKAQKEIEEQNLQLQQEIADRKRAEEALRESEERFRDVVEHSHDLICTHDLDGRILSANQRAAGILGCDQSVLLKMNIRDILVPEVRDEFDTYLATIERDGFASGLMLVQTSTGERRIWEYDNILRTEGVTAPIVRGMAHDITERKRAEEALRDSEKRFRSVVQTATDAIVSIDGRGNIVSWNPAAETMFGYSADEAIGKPFAAMMPKRFREAHQKAMQRVLSTGESELVGKTVEVVGLRKDGSKFPVEFSLAMWKAKGQAFFTAILRDITERKRAEQLLQALNDAALAMERAITHEEIFAAVADGFEQIGFSCAVFPTDESQSRLFPTYLSHKSKAIGAAEKLVGLQHENFSIPIETVDACRKVVQERETVFVENVVDIIRQLLPEPVKRFAGQMAKILKVPRAIDAPLIVEDEVIGLLAVQSDDLTEDDIPAITAFAHQVAAAWHKAQLMQDLQNNLEELKRTQAQLLQLQKMEAIGQLAAGIAHDFNNLLTPMGGFADLLLGKAPEDSPQHQYLHEIKIAVERAAALTSQLRLFARQAEGARRPVQLNDVIEETRNLLEGSIPKKITIELGLESELWAVEAEPSQISQVLVNLCVNARDAMPEGGTLTLKTCNVTLDEEYARMVLEARPGRYVRLSVSDTGCGMSPEVQARLFEPFFTTKEVGEGTGLGLAMAYGIVKGHDGFIQVYSEEERGSIFHVYLPALEEAVEERETEGLEWPTGTETILVVDDEDGVRALGQAVLEDCGYSVLMAEDGVQALEVYQAHQGEIGLVVLDVIMPRMGGLECLRRLREMAPSVKVLISTGYTARGLAQELVAEGALGVVDKPFRIQDFATAVRAALDQS